MAKQLFSPIEWDAHEYEHKERSMDWYWAVGIIAVSVAVASIIFDNVIFGILIIVAAASLSLFINRPPETIRMELDQNGITRGHVRYPMHTLRSFWIDEEHSHPKIIFRSHKMFMPLIVVPLGNADPERIHGALSKVMPEEYHALPWLEAVLEYLGF